MRETVISLAIHELFSVIAQIIFNANIQEVGTFVLTCVILVLAEMRPAQWVTLHNI